MAEEIINMSRKELDHLSIIQRVDRKELSQLNAAQMMGLVSATGTTLAGSLQNPWRTRSHLKTSWQVEQ